MSYNNKVYQVKYNPDQDTFDPDDEGEQAARNPLKKKNLNDLEMWDYMVGENYKTKWITIIESLASLYHLFTSAESDTAGVYNY